MTTARPAAPEPAPTVLRWVHAPHQARTREGLARLLEAAEELIAEKGIDETSIVDIAQRAASSVGSFYRRFHDKEGMLQALHASFCADARATTDDALAPSRWEGAALTEVLREFIAFLVQIFREREGLFRAFLAHSLSDAPMRERTLELFQYMSERIFALLAARRHEVRHPDPELAASFGLEMILGTLDHTIQLRQRALPFSDERLVAELTRAFASYLGVDDQPRLRISKRRTRHE